MIIFIAFLTLAISCSDTSFNSRIVDVDSTLGPNGGGELDSNSQVENEANEVNVEEELVSMPEMINGAYLVRECIELEKNIDESVIVCRVLEEQTKAKSAAQLDWSFTGSDGETISAEDIQVSYLGSENSWHIEIRTKVAIKVSVSLSSENQQIDEASAVIKGNEEVFGPEPGTEAPADTDTTEPDSPDTNEPDTSTTPEPQPEPVPEPEPIVPNITEDFTANTYDTNEWEVYNFETSFVNDSLTCTNSVTTPISHSGFTSKAPHDFTGGFASIELTDIQTLNVMEAQPFSWGIRSDINNRAHFLIEGESLIARYFNNGEFSNVFLRAFNSDTDKFFKITHDPDSNNLVYEISADGENWNIFALQPSQWPVSGVIFEYHCGAWGNYTGSFSSTVDNISVYLPTLPSE